MKKEELFSILSDQVLVGDGAMGTFIYSKGFPLTKSYDELNITHPQIISSIHEEYIKAGAELTETNTFSANRARLKRFGLENKVKEINYQGARIAKQIAGQSVIVAGAVGPITDVGKPDPYSPEEKLDMFYQQISALMEGGCDVIIIETFSDLDELLIALSAARKVGDFPVLCQMSFTRDLKTYKGVGVLEATRKLEEARADIIGINCGEGPHYNLKVIQKMCKLTTKKVSVFSNAGMPEYVDGRYIYLTTPQYFADIGEKMLKAGANIIGGCCGTNPEHIRALSQRIKTKKPVPRTTVSQVEVAEKRPPVVKKKEIFFEKSSQKIPILAEVDPPKGLDIQSALKKARKLFTYGVSAITVGDNPLATVRMGNIGFAHLLEKEGIPTILHMACRDRNLISLQSAIMEAHIMQIRAILAVTGDPARLGDQPGAASVFDLNSIELISLINKMNHGVSYTGEDLKGKTNFYIGCAFNPNVQNLDHEVLRLERKIKAGAQFVLMQAFYDVDKIKSIASQLKNISEKCAIFWGVMPLLNARNAHFIANEIPGIKIPKSVLARMESSSNQTEEGIKIAQELIDEASKHFFGIYIIPPFQNISIATRLIEYITAVVAKRQ